MLYHATVRERVRRLEDLIQGVLDYSRAGRVPDLPVAVGPQDIAVRFGYRDTAGSWSVSMEGDRGERAELEGALSATARAMRRASSRVRARIGLASPSL